MFQRKSEEEANFREDLRERMMMIAEEIRRLKKATKKRKCRRN